MRTVLIVVQAAALTLLAVLGAQGSADPGRPCPVSPVTSAIADRDCGS